MRNKKNGALTQQELLEMELFGDFGNKVGDTSRHLWEGDLARVQNLKSRTITDAVVRPGKPRTILGGSDFPATGELRVPSQHIHTLPATPGPGSFRDHMQTLPAENSGSGDIWEHMTLLGQQGDGTEGKAASSGKQDQDNVGAYLMQGYQDVLDKYNQHPEALKDHLGQRYTERQREQLENAGRGVLNYVEEKIQNSDSVDCLMISLAENLGVREGVEASIVEAGKHYFGPVDKKPGQKIFGGGSRKTSRWSQGVMDKFPKSIPENIPKNIFLRNFGRLIGEKILPAYAIGTKVYSLYKIDKRYTECMKRKGFDVDRVRKEFFGF